jgi:glycosyltransferase involved in cell wall biosynthesis
MKPRVERHPLPSTGGPVTRLAVFATHPVQYHVPLWRELSRRAGLDVTVYYFSDHSVRGGMDVGFQTLVVWDVPLLAGYRSVFLQRNADLGRPGQVRLDNARKLLSDGVYDAVLLQGYTHGFERQVLRAAGELGIKVLMRGEFSSLAGPIWKRPLKNIYLRWFYSRVHSFAVIGENARQHLAAQGVEEDRMSFSPYSVDTDLLEAQKKRFLRPHARRKLGYAKDDVVALFSGKIIERKQPMLFLDALSRVQEVKGLVIGDGPQMDQVRRRVESGLKDRVRLQGFVNQSELGLYFGAADFLVLPSLAETWGLVVNEAMQFGLPVIVSDRVGCRMDLVKPGYTGYVFPAGDVMSLSRAIGLLAGNKAFRTSMGGHAKDLIRPFNVVGSADGVVYALRNAISQ